MKNKKDHRCGWGLAWCFVLGMLGAAAWPVARDFAVSSYRYWKAPRCPVCHAKLGRVWYEQKCPDCNCSDCPEDVWVSYCDKHMGRVMVTNAR